jgi:hypothetical protein
VTTLALEPTIPPKEDDSHILEIGIAISAAFLAYLMIARPLLKKYQAREVKEKDPGLFDSLRGVWMALALPVAKQIFTTPLRWDQAETLAIAYATELGEYVNQTSVEALVKGYTAQVNAGWGEGLAWDRATQGFGLDPTQMRTYITGLMKKESGWNDIAVPPQAQAALDKAILVRADRLGQNESYKAVQVGKNMIWMAMEASGDLPSGTLKKWVTAQDERVCPVCGPLDQVTVALHHKFSSPTGNEKFYAPGVHPRCRCRIEIVYPPMDDVVKNMPGDPYDRNEDGEFASVELRHQEQNVDVVLNPMPRQILKPMKALHADVELKPMFNLRPMKRHVLQAFTQEEIQVANEVQTSLEEEINRNKRRQTRLHEDGVLYIPGSVQGGGISQFDARTMATPETHNAAVGQPLTFPTEQTGVLATTGTDAFRYALSVELKAAFARADAETAKAESGKRGRAVQSQIAPGVDVPNCNEFRESLSGLTNNQLLALMRIGLERSDPLLAMSLIEHSGEGTTPDEIIQYYDNRGDSNLTASAMVRALSSENRANLEPHSDLPWSHVFEEAWTIHNQGEEAKRRAFRDAGADLVQPVIPVVFRMANGWYGTPQGYNGAKASGSYLIGRIRNISVPYGTSHPRVDLVQHITVVDLLPSSVPAEQVRQRDWNFYDPDRSD